MRLAPGARLGPYEVVAPLGAGGMGEVYKARDTRLDRTVALKVIAPDVAADSGFRLRFEREARTVSALNHPHICTLHDIGQQDGTDYLVLEYLEGETLADRIRQHKRLPLDELLRYATEVARALDAAHAHGIVHRDLKPGNVMITSSGAKLLDFGLAKAAASSLVSGATAMVTHPGAASGQGTIVGTLQYMAPEQLLGREADTRTDLFALGLLIYEMATGARPFDGDTQASIIAKILESQPPPLSARAPLTPGALEHLVHVCLAKDPAARWQSARDVGLQLQWIRDHAPEGAPAIAAGRHQWRERIAWALVVIAATAGVAGWVLQRPSTDAARSLLRFTLTLPSDVALEDWRGAPLLSPDGRSLVVAGAVAGRPQLLLRHLDQAGFVPLPGTENARLPFWSPDSRSNAFSVGLEVKRLDVNDGSLFTIAQNVNAMTGTWNEAGDILVSQLPTAELLHVSDAGGTPQPATRLDTKRGDTGHRRPSFLPGGRRFLVTVAGREPGVYVGSLDGGPLTRLLTDASDADYHGSGHLLFVRQHTVMAIRFDPERLQVSGTPFPVLGKVVGESAAAALYSAAPTGLVYRPAIETSTQLAWYSRSGARLAALGPTGPYQQVALSPSGTRVAIQYGATTTTNPESDIWLMETGTGILSRLTTDTAFEGDPSWSPDERRLAFTTARNGPRTVFVKDLDSGDERPAGVFPTAAVLDHWTPDGRFFVAHTGSRFVYVLLADGSTAPRVVRETPQAIEDQCHVSPDGRWIAFNSQESGRWEVYVASFPDFSSKRQVSAEGGVQPLWRRDGRELFYLTPQGRLMTVEITGSTALTVGGARPLFQTGLTPSPQVGEYAVDADGKRCLIAERPPGLAQTLLFLANWMPGADQR